jgi:hypothetical protein
MVPREGGNAPHPGMENEPTRLFSVRVCGLREAPGLVLGVQQRTLQVRGARTPGKVLSLPPLYPHQEEALAWLLPLTDSERGRVCPGANMLAFEMRLGKTRIAIEYAKRLFLAREIDQTVVVCPAEPVLSRVWYHPEFGQWAEYCDVPIEVVAYRPKMKTWARGEGKRLRVWVSNYEFIRRPERLTALTKVCDRRTLLVIDESSAVSSPTSDQTKAVYKLRQKCGRVLELNGTPEGDNPGDLYAQFKILDPAIIGCPTWGAYKATYAVTQHQKIWCKGGIGRDVELIVSWRDLEELGRRTAPYVLKKRTADVMPTQDPDAAQPTTIVATLTPESPLRRGPTTKPCATTRSRGCPPIPGLQRRRRP